MKKNLIKISLLILFSICIPICTYAYPPYYDATAELNQVNYYISQGMYLEAANVCEYVLSGNISDYDINLFTDLKNKAWNLYQSYYDEINKWSYYYEDVWGMGFSSYTTPVPFIRYTDEWNMDVITVYDDGYGNRVNISSCHKGLDLRDGYIYTNPTAFVNSYVNFKQGMSSQDPGYGSYFEILSLNDTTVGGNIPAKQAVVRTSWYTNQAKSKTHSLLEKCIAFEYYDYIYIISASEYAYNWSDQLWELFETVRNSISFY